MDQTMPLYPKSPNKSYEIEDYIILCSKLLGEGSFGEVYEGYHKHNPSEKLAIKVINLSMVSKQHRQIARNLFEKEVNSLINLPHPNILNFQNMIITADYLYLITELCPEGDLLQFCGKIPEEKALFYLRKIVEAMIFVHKNKIIHRNLRPDNILMKAGEPKIAGFGLSQAMESLENCEPMIDRVGSPLYMAPEVLSWEKYCSKCDVWSVGVMFFQMIFDETPWTADNSFIILKKIKQKSLEFPKNKAISEKSKQIIIAMLEKDRTKRIDFEGVLTLLNKNESFPDNKLENDASYLEKLQNLIEKTAKNLEISEYFGINEEMKSHVAFLFKKFAMFIYMKKCLIRKNSNSKEKPKNIEKIHSFYAEEQEVQSQTWESFKKHYTETMDMAITELYKNKDSVWPKIKNPKTFITILHILQMKSIRIRKNFKYKEKDAAKFENLQKQIKNSEEEGLLLKLCRKKIEDLFV